MTTIEATTAARADNGVLTAARLNFVGWPLRLGIPWLVVTVTLAVNVLILAVAGENDGGTTGALLAIYLAGAISYLQTITQAFGFALSVGVTRRHFYLGAGVVVLVESLLHGIGMTVMLGIERATGGWGFDVTYFGIPFLVQDNPFLQVLAYAGPLVGLSFVAMMYGTVFKRWGQSGVWTALIATTALVGLLAVLATWQGWWPAVGRFFVTTPQLALTVGFPVLIALVAGGIGYLLLRRATP